MWPRGWVEVQLYSSMTAALEGGGWSATRPGRPLPPGKTRYPSYRRLGGPQGRSGRAANFVLTGIQSRTFQPVVSRYTDWATRSTLPHWYSLYYTKVSQMKTLNRVYLLIYWTQKVHNDFIFLCSIALPPVDHSSNHQYHCWNLQNDRAVFRIFTALLRFSFDSPS
jgi:hypothetical protein